MDNEEKLFQIAKEVVKLNKRNIPDLKLTGSLSLYALGYVKCRKAADIDFICDSIFEENEGAPIVPNGFRINYQDGTRSQIECLQFINDEGIKIEFMVSEERYFDDVEGVPCANPQNILLSKLYFAKNDLNEESKMKHLDDVIYFLKNNELIMDLKV